MTTLNWTAIIVAAISLFGTIITAYFLYKAKLIGKNNKPKNNPGPNPGGSLLCLAHGDRLLKIELENERVCRELKELQSEVRRLRERMDA